VISASSSQFHITKVGEDISDLPWRRPPTIIPKDVKGKELYDTNLNISPLEESKHHKSRFSKSANKSTKSKKHHHHHHHHHHKGDKIPQNDQEPPPPPEKWDENFVYESHGSPSKRFSGKSLLHSGSGVGGVLSKAILGSRHYSTPPPPPRKLNRYPLSLGVDKPTVTLTDPSATVTIGNEVLRVPLLTSPGMHERLSPKKSSSATPLFPGAEQYWEGYVESLENQEQNMTSHFREQVNQQNEENFRTQQLNAPPPPPLPSEQFEGQYTEASPSGSEDYYSSESRSRSQDYEDSREGSYSDSEDMDRYRHSRSDEGRNRNSARDFNDSREYYDDDDDDDDEGHEQDFRGRPSEQTSRSPEAAKSGLTSQKRGTFFGLYSKNTPDNKQGQNHSEASAAKRTTSPPGKGPGQSRGSGQQASSQPSSSSGLTSQRRGTFFGLYKNKDKDKDKVTDKEDAAPVHSQSRSPAATVTHRTTSVWKPTTSSNVHPNTQKQQQPSSTGKQASPKQQGALTSQRRGTFFGLYQSKDGKHTGADENLVQNEIQPRQTTSVHKPTATRATALPSRGSTSDEKATIKHQGGLTSQKRGTLFGLYEKEDGGGDGGDGAAGAGRHEGAGGKHMAVKSTPLSHPAREEPPQERNEEAEELKKDSPEALQNVLQQMYERKIETLRNLKATRDKVHVNN
jgi:hypothetical protein